MRVAFVLVAALLADAPAAPVVSYAPGTEFSRFHSYTWVFTHPPSGIDQTLYRQIRHSVDASLAAHGFVQSDPGDFAVAFTVGPRAQMHAYDFGHYAPYYGGNEATAHQKWVNNELVGRRTHAHTLAIDIYDNYSKHAVWHGVAPVPISPHMRPAIVEHEVDDVLALFPPKAVCSRAPNGGPDCAQ